MSGLVIVDYGAGNLCSVSNAIRHLGASFIVSGERDAIQQADALILPGVGHFGHLAAFLDRGGFGEAIGAHCRADKPFLGICLGMQALFDGSEESPEAHSLGLYSGGSFKIGGGVKTPHIGWDTVILSRESRLFQNLPEEPCFYFAHSYALPLCPERVATCDYGLGFSAAIESGNTFGTQFHPEKSGDQGLQLLKNFLEIAEC
jgi:imidazole glycerol phosphate synthase glutamine amidotransferase subunit